MKKARFWMEKAAENWHEVQKVALPPIDRKEDQLLSMRVLTSLAPQTSFPPARSTPA